MAFYVYFKFYANPIENSNEIFPIGGSFGGSGKNFGILGTPTIDVLLHNYQHIQKDLN